MKPTSRKWIEAAKILGADPSAVVRCPEHDDDILTVEDVSSPADPDLFDRHLRCQTCGAQNVLVRMRRSSSRQ